MAGLAPPRLFTALGLTPGLVRGGRSALTGLTVGLGFGLFMAAADASVFHGAVPEVQRVIVREWPLGERLGHFLIGAVHDELVLRLVGVTALLALFRAAGWPRARAGGGEGGALAVLIAAAVLWPLSALAYLGGLEWSALTLAREAVLHVGAGLVWGWLYCRHGWLAGVIGHGAAHLALQPLLPLVS